MSWDTVFIIGFTLLCLVSAIVALCFGVTWGGSWDNILSVRRAERPFAFWFMTVLWVVFTAVGAYGVYLQFTGVPSQA